MDWLRITPAVRKKNEEAARPEGGWTDGPGNATTEHTTSIRKRKICRAMIVVRLRRCGREKASRQRKRAASRPPAMAGRRAATGYACVSSSRLFSHSRSA
jgi:hypothetical protein